MTPEQKKLYDYDYFRYRAGKEYNVYKRLRMGDMLAALCYALDITYDELMKGYPDYFIDNRDGYFVDKNFSIHNQMGFLQKNKKRNPKHILEIGGGRGEIAVACNYLKIPITSIEPSLAAKEWYKKTALHFFNKYFTAPEPLNIDLENFNDDLSKFDTIIMVESLEHIYDYEFDKFWASVKNSFKGYFITTNWQSTFPIVIGDWDMGDIEHCRLIDESLYDRLCADATRTIYRHGSHLILEF